MCCSFCAWRESTRAPKAHFGKFTRAFSASPSSIETRLTLTVVSVALFMQMIFSALGQSPFVYSRREVRYFFIIWRRIRTRPKESINVVDL